MRRLVVVATAVLACAGHARAAEYWLGLSVAPPSEELRKKLDLRERQGLMVQTVSPGSPAAKAGLKPEDIVLKAGDKPLANIEDLIGAVQESKGREMLLQVNQGGKVDKFSVRPARRDLGILGSAPAETQKPGEARPDLYGDPLPSGAIARLGTVRFRHNSTAIAYSPDGKILASGGRDNVIRLFDAATGKELRRLTGHQKTERNTGVFGGGGVPSVAFSPDGKTLASGGWDRTVRLWDVETGEELLRIDAHQDMVGHVVFSPDGKVLASRGAFDGTVKLWDAATGAPLRKLTGLPNINTWRMNRDMALAISPDSKTLVTTARNALVFYDLASGAELQRLPAHVYGLTVAYSPDGKLLASGGVDEGHDVYSLRIWDVASGTELRKCELSKMEPPIYVSWDPNNTGKLAAVVEEDVMHIFDAGTGKEVTRLKHYWPSRVTYAPDGKTLASAGSGPSIRLWDAATGKELQLEYQGHQLAVAAAAINADGKLVASGGENLGLWDRASSKLVRTIDVNGGVTCLAFAPDGKTLACGGVSPVVRLWDVETGRPAGELKPHANSVRGLAFSGDGKLLASGDAQSTVRIWNVKDGKPMQVIDNKSIAENLSFAFISDDKSLLCAGAWNDSGFRIPKGTTFKINGKEVGKVDGKFSLNIQGITMEPKEGTYALQWDVSSGKEVRKFGGLKETLRGLALSPDGKLVAASSKDGKICLWDVDTGKDRLYIAAHPGQTESPFQASPHLAFSPDSKTLASASTDHTIRLWDVTNAKEMGRFRDPDSEFSTVVFTPDGKNLISGSAETGVLVWETDAAEDPSPGEPSKTISIR